MSEWRPWVFANKKAIIWDLDNTLYRITPEFGDILDSVMARVCVEQLGVDLDFETAKAKVKESFAQYRDGGEIFYRDYGVDVKEFYNAYHNNVPYEMIVPYEGLAERLRQLPLEQYVFTYSSHSLAEKILKHLGLYDIFKGRFYSVEDFNHTKKNESAGVYLQLCDKIGAAPEDCIFVDDSYSNLIYPKEIGMTTVRLYYRENSAKGKDYIDAAYNGINKFLDDFIPLVNHRKPTGEVSALSGKLSFQTHN